jgi:hypothetical protein
MKLLKIIKNVTAVLGILLTLDFGFILFVTLISHNPTPIAPPSIPFSNFVVIVGFGGLLFGSVIFFVLGLVTLIIRQSLMDKIDEKDRKIMRSVLIWGVYAIIFPIVAFLYTVIFFAAARTLGLS